MFLSKICKSGCIFCSLLAAMALAGADCFFVSQDGEKKLENSQIQLSFPGENRLFERQDIKVFRPDRNTFSAGELVWEARLKEGESPVKFLFYMQNKDGIWYQSCREYQVTSGDWQKFSIRIDRQERDWCGVGHGGCFSAQDLLHSSVFGVTFFREGNGEAVLEFRPFRFEGKREVPELAVRHLNAPDAGPVNKVVEARFELSREYFNPFDPDEISVDYELKHPDGHTSRHPGFFGRDQRRELYHARESILPSGKGYWAIRFLPMQPGEYQYRLCITEQGKEVFSGAWQTFTAQKSDLPGYVQVSASSPNFFELSTGEFFFPVGLNIHTNSDRAGESLCDTGRLPDRGLTDTLEYFEQCYRNGITLIELWMAGWSLALEHTAAYPGYYGVGHYNMGNAWKLDQLLDKAREYGIRINLIVDNHGRLSEIDNEWDRNPANKKSEFAVANGAYLDAPPEYFRKEEGHRQDWKRARYIAARWGADPAIFAVELWSELNLVVDFWQLCKDGTLVSWIKNTREAYDKMAPRKQLITVHYAGTFHNILGMEKPFSETGVTHYAGDAYRDINQPFPDHFADYRNHMKRKVPVLVTEFGDQVTRKGRTAKLRAELHYAMWCGTFARPAGAPMIWWHDLVHFNNLYKHHKGLAEYLKGVDFRGKRLEYYSPAVTGKNCSSLAVAVDAGTFGWVGRRDFALKYPDEEPPALEDVTITLTGVPAGKWQLRWFDTLKGEISHEVIEQKNAGNLVLKVPSLSIDRAFRLEVVK